jgi:hypothetical protein
MIIVVKELLYRVPECLSSRLDWVPPPPPPEPSVAPHLGPTQMQGSHTRLFRAGWGDPIQTTGQTLWYSTYIVIPLQNKVVRLYRYTTNYVDSFSTGTQGFIIP